MNYKNYNPREEIIVSILFHSEYDSQIGLESKNINSFRIKSIKKTKLGWKLESLDFFYSVKKTLFKSLMHSFILASISLIIYFVAEKYLEMENISLLAEIILIPSLAILGLLLLRPIVKSLFSIPRGILITENYIFSYHLINLKKLVGTKDFNEISILELSDKYLPLKREGSIQKVSNDIYKCPKFYSSNIDHSKILFEKIIELISNV